MRCITDACGRPLTAHDTRQGFTRCRHCRSRADGAHPFNVALRRKPEPPQTTMADSWWTRARRDGFTSEAQRRHAPTLKV